MDKEPSGPSSTGSRSAGGFGLFGSAGPQTELAGVPLAGMSPLSPYLNVDPRILNMVTRQGATWANTLNSIALLYSAFGVNFEKARGAEDDVNTIAAGTLTGVIYKSPGGLRGAARGGLLRPTLSGLYALYNNWDHLKGGSPTCY
ncbi:mitochondrial import inner membrane translocase subunit Tim23-like [Sinocyclocheilus anshuiensis]|uniref:mitochondrial import inner membrane translocase subunit Tim23-like n=1 Tax=Sinocyclocheilus anshuiensis TaxID=1608454 RepID=UPI0007B7E5DD|nr:PREDICTED: mitochondrial import inner membrane translocase subunit Tim23-like [Sinocyclocheilus anshuiensis]